MLRCTIGSTGAEGLAPAQFASSLQHSTSNAPMPSLTPSVQPVTWLSWLWSLLDLHLVLRLALMPGRRNFRQPSDAPSSFHWLRCHSAFLWVLSSCFALHDLYTSSPGYKNIHLTKPLVPLIALSFDHQNHSKWHNGSMFVTRRKEIGNPQEIQIQLI